MGAVIIVFAIWFLIYDSKRCKAKNDELSMYMERKAQESRTRVYMAEREHEKAVEDYKLSMMGKYKDMFPDTKDEDLERLSQEYWN